MEKEKVSLKVKIRRWWKNYKSEARWKGWAMPLIEDYFPFYNKINRAYWWVRHRTTNVYHKVDTGLRPGWYDTDHLMLHSCFELLRGYVEEEMDGYVGVKAKIKQLYESWEEDKETGWERRPDNNKYDYQKQIDVLEEALRLYLWWLVDYPKYEDKNPYMKNFDALHPDGDHLFGTPSTINRDKDGDPVSYSITDNASPAMRKKRREVMKKSMEYEIACIEETTENFISLVKIRSFLWT
jgi:hypothetical protein